MSQGPKVGNRGLGSEDSIVQEINVSTLGGMAHDVRINNGDQRGRGEIRG